MTHPTEQDPLSLLIAEIRPYLHRENDPFAAASILAKKFGQPRPNNKQEALSLLNELLHALLHSERFADAAALLWQEAVFDGRPECVKSIWGAIPEESLLALQGGSSMGKSYTPCVWLMLDWLRDPEWTSIICVGPKQDHLQNNVFSTLVRLHQSSSIPLPGDVGDLFIGMNRRDSFGGFKGLVIPRSTKGVVLQGMTKAQKRTGAPHPSFGTQGRVRVFVDEIEDCPPLIHQDLANVMSGIDKENADRLKIIIAYNPKYANGPVATLAEPQSGWDAFDIENDLDWKSKRGWRVLRLDPHRSENVLNDTKEFGGLQTRDALDALRSSAGGEDTSLYCTFGRGAFPRTSASCAAVPQAWLSQSVGQVTWLRPPDTYMGGDLALGGDATCAVILRTGTISERRWQGWEDDPSRRLVFPTPRPCIFLESGHFVQGKETMQLANDLQKLARSVPVVPNNINLDPGGPGAGIVDVMRAQWSQDIMRTWGGEGPSEKKFMEEDKAPANETLRYAADEMWLALRRYFEHGFIVVSDKLPDKIRQRLFYELSSRLWKDQTLTKLEGKNDYKRRMGGKSPDVADALGLGVHAVRLRGQFRPSARDGARAPDIAPAAHREKLNLPGEGVLIFGDPDALMDHLLYGTRPHDYTDPTNSFDSLG